MSQQRPAAAAWTTHGGLATLGDQAVTVVDTLDSLITDAARRSGAQQRRYPAAFPAGALADIDFFQNFPHLAAPISGLTDSAQERHSEQGLSSPEVPPSDLAPAGYLLPSAACYGVFFDLHGQQLDTTRLLTTRAACFRRETGYDDLRRLWNFQMREIVYLGSADGAQQHIEHHTARIRALGDRLGLELSVEPATDPFYQRAGSRALLQRLDPVKWEFVVEGCAIASVNLHRNFFGERCAITDGAGSPVFSGCVAFGLERWLYALYHAHHGDLEAAHAALRAAATEPVP